MSWRRSTSRRRSLGLHRAPESWEPSQSNERNHPNNTKEPISLWRGLNKKQNCCGQAIQQKTCDQREYDQVAPRRLSFPPIVMRHVLVCHSATEGMPKGLRDDKSAVMRRDKHIPWN